MDRQLIFPMDDKYQSYLSDESHMTGFADSISFPENENEIRKIIAQVRNSGQSITIQGGKTGIAGCAVPNGGHVLNMSYMNHVKSFRTTEDGHFLLTVEPGVTLLDLTREIKKLDSKEELFWPPDPTEPSATVGGVAACNSRGLTASLYGDAKEYIHTVRVMDAEGKIMEITCGKESGASHCATGDISDIYIGGEGMFGVVTELTLALLRKPREIWGICFFFSCESDAFSFAELLVQYAEDPHGAKIAAAEYMDRMTIDMIEERKPNISRIRELPDASPDAAAMIYVEIHGADEASVEICAEALLEMAEACHVAADATWAVSGEFEVDRLRAFRHTAAESANLHIEKISQTYPGITKLGMDMNFNGQSLAAVVSYLKGSAEKSGLKLCIFGHIFGNHLHPNILPENREEFLKGQEILTEWAVASAKNPGVQNREHGVGKIKKQVFLATVTESCLKEIREKKKNLDPQGFWNPGNMIDTF
ncbi:MAG: FAD-binding oxidoreductase [Eubacteriales bacterium]